MSRIGQKPIEIPTGVGLKVAGSQVEVKGPLGVLNQEIRPEIKVKTEGNQVLVARVNNTKLARSLHGLTRTLIANMILGVTEGFKKDLEIQGTGYRVKLEGDKLVFSLGFSHPVVFESIEGIKFEVADERKITVSGINKILVGNVAAKIRKIRPPDAYKGKGIRYQGEEIKLKPGKAGKAGAGEA
jgi:large subunit ribosomal protein L6